MCDRRMAAEYFANYIEFMAHFSMLEMVAKPKHPINICDYLANKADKAERRLIQKVFSKFCQKKFLYSE